VGSDQNSSGTHRGTAAFAGNVSPATAEATACRRGATATGNAILGNSIFANAGLGIDLGDDG
jgi:hypothetical protein